MAYFDDPGHRAAWEKELDQAREEKARRKSGLPPQTDPGLQGQDTPGRNRQAAAGLTSYTTVKITYRQLVEKEFGAVQRAKQLSRSAAPSLQREKTKEAGGRQR